MAFKKKKYRSSGKREVIIVDYKHHLTTNEPYKPLTVALKATGGRNNTGKITTRHRGGDHKKRYRIIDFKRDKDNVVGIVKTIEYDPNRTSFICLISYLDGEKRYIIAPDKLKVGDKIMSGEKAEIQIGNTLPIKNIPEGTVIHNIEMLPGKGAQIIRSAGSQAQILGPDETGKYIVIKLPSGELRKILNNCKATIGRVSNLDHTLVVYGKAGTRRNMGIKPTVRGVAMNPNDHVHGGGEGRCSIGRDAPRTPWGKKHMGVKTRAKRKPSNSMIVTSRHINKKKKKN